MQVALALVLVVSAALMIRTFQALRDVDPGFRGPGDDPNGADLDSERPASATREQYTRMQHEILDKIAALPGVASAGFASRCRWKAPPFIQRADRDRRPDAARPEKRRRSRGIKFVSPGYFAAMGTRIIAGRDITWSDIEAGGRVALISEEFARELAGEPAAALGKRIRDTRRDAMPGARSSAWCRACTRTALYADAPSFVYWPALMEDMFGAAEARNAVVAFVIRSDRAGTASFMDEIRQAIWSVNGSVPIALERTMQDLYAGSLARTSFALVMLAIAGGDGARARRHRDLRRHRLRRLAADSRNRDSARRSAPSHGGSGRCSCCTGSR